MELLAESSSATRPEVPAAAMTAGATAAQVISSVRGAERRFARMRGFRDRALFFLSPPARIAVTRPLAQLMKHGISRREWILVLAVTAVLTSVLFNLTNLLLVWETWLSGAQYTYFTFLNPDAMANLAPMIRDVLDGYWFPSDGRLSEYHFSSNLWSPITPLLFAPFLFITKSVPFSLLVSRLMVVAVSYPLLYLLAFRLTRHRAASALFSAVFLLAPLLWFHLPPTSLEDLKIVARSLLPLGSPPGEVLLSKYNSFSIMPALPFMIFGLLSVLMALERRNLRWSIVAGAMIGFLILIYLTHAIYVAVIFIIASAILIVKRQRGVFRTLFWSAITASIVSVPFWFNYLSIRTFAHANEFYARLGGDQTHAFRWSEWFDYLLYALFAYFVYHFEMRKRRPAVAVFLTGSILAAVAVENIQVLLGYNPAPTVWRIHQIFFGFGLAWFVLFLSLYEWMRVRLSHGRVLAPTLAIAIVLMISGRAVYAEAYAFGYSRGFTHLPSSYRDAFLWLEANASSGSVIVTPSLSSNSLIPYLTGHDTLIGKAITSPASEEELIDRLFVSYSLFNVPWRYLEQGLTKKVTLTDSFAGNVENGLVTWLFEYRFVGIGLNEFYKGGSRDVPDDVVQDLVARYERYPRRAGFLLGRYRIDYLLVGPMERQIMRADLGSMPYLEKVYDANDVQLYSVRREKLTSI